MPTKAKRTKPKVSRRRPIAAKDLFNLKLPTAVAMSPDERHICYTVEQIDAEDNKYYSNLHMYDLAADCESQFTHGKQNDGQPIWSPDGNNLVFVSVRDKKTGIYVMPSAGGSERKLLEVDGAVGDIRFTPDGQGLVFHLRYNDSHFIEDEKKKKEPPVFRHVTRLWYKLDGAGYLPKDIFQIYHLDIKKTKLRKITSGKRDNYSPSISPDGRSIAYVSCRARRLDLDHGRLDLFVIPFKGGKERKIPTPSGPIYDPTFSPDGKTIAYLGHDNPEDAWGVTNVHVWKVGVNGRPKAHDLMPKFDRMAYDQSISDTGDVHDVTPITWSADGKKLFFLSSDTGSTNLFSVPATGGKPTRIFDDKCHIKDYSVNGRTRQAAIIYSDLNTPGEIMTCPTTHGAASRAVKHTELSRFLHTEIKLGQTREVMFRSFDGTRVQGWMVLPPKFTPTRKYPSILQIHGGPRVQYAHTFFHEMQYLAAKGYVVFYTNPRGGAGRGETWADAIAGGWGDLDYKDCMAAADYLEKQSFINPKKMGVTGGSYGGYMTNWIIGHTNRFKAAVTQRSVVDLKSFVGSSDFGFSLFREFDGWPWDNRENYDKCSPITYFNKVHTPVLIIHSESDLRCCIEQAEQMFAMLKVLGKKVEMVRFPGEPHGLSRHGRPDRRIARLEWIVKWFDRYLRR